MKKYAYVNKYTMTKIKALMEIVGKEPFFDDYEKGIIIFDPEKIDPENIYLRPATFETGKELQNAEEIDVGWFINKLLQEITLQELTMWIVEKEVQHEYKL